MSASILHDALDITHPDVSLGSLNSSFASSSSAPGFQSHNSSTSGPSLPSTAPIATPIHSPPTFNARGKSDDELGSLTPGRAQRSLLGEDTPVMDRRTNKSRPSTTHPKTTTTLTLREQEKLVEAKDKEIFNLKLQLHFLNEKLSSKVPEDIEVTVKNNIDIKILNQTLQMDVKSWRKAARDLERELKNLQAHSDKTSKDLEDQLDDREKEIDDLRQRLLLRNNTTPNDQHSALLDKYAALEDELENAKSVLQETNDELERLRDALEAAQSHRSSTSGGSRMDRRLEELERRNQELEATLEDAQEAVAERDQLIESLEDANATLRLDVEHLDHERQRAMQERSESRAEVFEEREEREALEEGNNALRDRLAAMTIALEQKENDLEARSDELATYAAELDARVQEVEDWKTEVQEERARAEELQDGIAERETQIKDLQLRVNELESNQAELHDKFEVALAHLEKEGEDKDAELNRLEIEREEKDAEIESANREIERLGARVWELEEELERTTDRLERELGEVMDRAQLHEELSDSLKDKLAQAKAELTELRNRYNDAQAQAREHRARAEDLASRMDEVTRARDTENLARTKAEREMREYGDKLLDAEDEIKSLRRELSDVERSLNNKELDEKTSTRILESELERLKKDLARREDELDRARNDVKDRERVRQERETLLDKLHDQNRDLSTQLASQTQARLNLSDKLDMVQASVKQAETDLSAARARVTELEQKLNKDQRSILATENQYRDQLTERNTLLLTIYQYMDKILGVDKTPKKGVSGETKPFTNFSVFHDNLINRLKALSQIQLDFDRRVKESEARFTDKLADVKKQLDFRWKQIDRFETSVKNLAEVKNSWRRKYNIKEGELEASKASNAELASQISSLKRSPAVESSHDIRALTARATQAERRATVAQNQLAQLEERLAGQNDRTGAAELKWEARIKEYERLLKEANEKFKRERQGAKERVAELENNIETLQKQIEQTNKRAQQLNDVMEAAGKQLSPPGRIP